MSVQENILQDNRPVHAVLLSFVASVFALIMSTRFDAPSGQALYLLSKYVGLAAFVLMWFQLFVSQLVKLSLLPAAISPGSHFHILAGTSVFLAIVTHGTLFLSAVSVRAGHPVLHLLVPNLAGGYYELGLSIGVIAMFTVLIAVYFGYRRMSGSARRYIHMLVYLVFFMAMTHAMMIGSETRSSILEFLFWVMTGSIILLLLMRSGKNHMRRAPD